MTGDETNWGPDNYPLYRNIYYQKTQLEGTCHYLCSKSNRMLGLVKHTCHFVNNPNQKMSLYLSIVCSQFYHCSSIWRRNSITLLNERVQITAGNGFSEQDSTYLDMEYF